MKYDVITLGSASMDLFVKSSSEEIKHQGHIDLCYPLGDKILIEDIEYNTGGGGTNTAVAFSRLGLKTGFIGVVGDDENGEKILKELKKEKVDFLGRKKKGKTGISVILPGENDRTILTFKGVNNDLHINDIALRGLDTKWIYVSTMLGESLATIKKIIPYARKRGWKVAFNPSLYLARQGISQLKSMLKNIDILVLNKQEFFALTGKKEPEYAFAEIAQYVSDLVVVTDGPNPVHVYDGKRIYTKPIKEITPVDSTGAGDAFTSGFLYGLLNHKDIPTCLDYGYKESLSVMGAIGAKNNLLRRI